ncbi:MULTISPECIES: DUF5335 family protein [Rhizobium]|jgi:hypothetical protein|uniref:DUF5335 family protein n=1 Tax=Rhizobium TaxID=379 RepID=UPI000DDFC57B|nr:DUF5335 family protein [Rhizobium lusitanum]NTJ09635.1 DUF5335 family protein [Rhizobium lusitanum]
MMSKTIAPAEWQAYFKSLVKTLSGKHVRVEVVGITLGDQVLTSSSPLLGMTYEPKKNTLEISLDGLEHIINCPKAISIREDDGTLVALDIVDQDDRHQIVTLLPSRQP